jgi:hypothetical protein
MNQLIESKIFIIFIVSAVLVCFGLSPQAQAVSPPPDGGYPGGNTAEGQSALLSLTTGGFNTAAGYLSLRSDTTGSFNTAVGAGTLLANTAIENTATGAGALLSNTTGSSNTANGAFALFNNTQGTVNTAVGFEALFHNTIGSGNTALGVDAGNGVTTASSVICIGISGANVTNSCFIGNIFGVTTANAATPVLVDSAGQLGTISSSRRFKNEIKSMDQTSEAILALKPVTFHYKSDKTNTPQFGLIAEEVAEVNPDLVVRDKNGDIYSVRYEAVNAMLLNEFLKEHRKVEEQQATIGRLETTVAKQEKGLQVVTARLQEQAAQIQKVSARLEMSKPAPKTVLNNQ